MLGAGEELKLIVAAAGELQAADEPSPRVWNSIESALRQEGLIRPQAAADLTAFLRRPLGMRRDGWYRPRRMLLLTVGIYERRQSLLSAAKQRATLVEPVVNQSGLNDEDLMQEVLTNPPADEVNTKKICGR